MNQRIISNKVYESLQVPTGNTRTTTGKILYANSFSGVSPVSMPDDLKNLIDSDYGLIGMNILMQLSNKMQAYYNGPWYVDSRDGIIYIHNRKFHEDPVTIYTYQGENGEVLRVSFSLRKMQSRKQVHLGPELDPETKDIDIDTTSIDDKDPMPKDVDELAKKDPLSLRNDNASTVLWNPTHQGQSMGALDNPGEVPDEIYKSRLKKAEIIRQDKKAVEEYQSKGPALSQYNSVKNYLDNMPIDKLKGNINTMANALPANKQAALSEIMNNPAGVKGTELYPVLRKSLENVNYMFTEDEGITAPVESMVDAIEFDPQGRPKAGVATDSDYMESAKRGLEVLKKNPGFHVLDDNLKLEYIPEHVDDWADRGRNELYSRYTEVPQRRCMVKVIKNSHKTVVTIPAIMLYDNLFSRAGGVDRYTWAVNVNKNGGLKVEEKKLICTMQVVGRPLLETSQIIILENVGKRWGGPWYIKQCTHTMDAGQGYLVNLELVRNYSKPSTSTSKATISSQSTVANDAKVNAKTDMGKSKMSLSNNNSFLDIFTYDEVTYFKEAFLNHVERLPEGSTFDDFQHNVEIKDPKGMADFLEKKYYWNYESDASAVEKAEGIAVSTENTVTSKGAWKGKFKLRDIQLPPGYKNKFDMAKIAQMAYIINQSAKFHP